MERATQSSLSLVIAHAKRSARQLNESYLSTEHLLDGLLLVADPALLACLRAAGTDPEQIRAHLYLGPCGQPTPTGPIGMTPRAERILAMAHTLAHANGRTEADGADILVALIRDKDGLAARVLRECGLTDA